MYYTLMTILKNKVLIFILISAVIVLCLIEAAGKGDFFIYLSGAGDLMKGEDIYKNTYVDGYHYFYSVLFALLLYPFYHLPFFWVKFFWLLINAVAYFHLFALISKSRLFLSLKEKQQKLFLFLLFVFSLRFFLDNIHYSQITIFILWCTAFGLQLILNNKTIAGSALLALGINIKLLPIVFLPYLIYRGYFKAFTYTVLFYFSYLFLPALFIGFNYNLSLIKTWLSLINPANQNHILDVEERSFHSLSTLLSTLLVKDVPDIYALSLKRNIANIDLKSLSYILTLIRLVLISLTLYFLKLKIFVKSKTNLGELIEISYILLLIPLIFPHQQHYAFLFMIPAIGLILFYLITNYNRMLTKTKMFVYTLLIFIYLSANLKLLLGEFNRYYEHFKVLTYGALLVIPLLIWVDKKNNLS